MRTSPTTRALAALVVGLASGILVEASDNVFFERVTAIVEPIGTLWVNGVRMTIVPLIVSLLVVGVSGETSLRSMRRLGGAPLVVFLAAPIGVFALALSLGARMGVAAAGAIGYYIGTLVILLLILTMLLYPVAVFAGGIGLRRFASAMAPAQVIAFSSRSSSVALPAMITAARDRLQLPPSAVDFVLPLAVTVFRVSAPISIPVSVLFLAKLYGVEITTTQLLALIGTSVALSFSIPPIPSGSLFLMAPVLASAGIPVEGVGLLIAADAIPDLFKTTAIVTSHMPATVVVARLPDAAARADEEQTTVGERQGPATPRVASSSS